MTEDPLKQAAEAEKKLREQLKTLRDIRKRRGPTSTAYESHKERAAARQAELSASGRDIGELPPVGNPGRKSDSGRSFRAFCENYFPATFALSWSPDHLEIMAAVESAVIRGELLAFAMPRGSGKTSMVEIAALWAILFGYRDFVAIIGADEAHASTMLDSIKVECETNERLLEDFPEAIFPIVALEKIHQRAKGQLFKGKPTHISWTADEVQFPAITGSPASGGIIRVAGIMGGIRGMSAKRAADGKKARPSLVLIDDPQTDESSKSPAQVAAREAVIKGAILGLAGPGKKISGLCTVTVIHRDDLADRLLDRQQHPAWHGRRMKLIYDWPESEDLWGQYAELRKEGQRTGAGVEEATAFYATHRTAMDAGARVGWEARHNEDELSALQHAWNLRIDRGEQAFASEFQNEPLVDDSDTGKLDKRGLALRSLNLARAIVPNGHNTLTAFVDVQEKLLFWSVLSWNESFGGHVVSYGTYPEQGSVFFEAKNAKQTLAMKARGAGFEGSLHAGLEALTVELLSREWKREDGAAMRIGQLLIDANWGQSTSTVRTFVRRSNFSALILPSHGRGIGASGQAIGEKKGARGDRLGLNWRIGQISEGQRSVVFDSNYWKTFIAARLRLALGDPESIAFHKGNHDLLCEHLTSEYPVRVEGRGRVVDEWKSAGRENHWLDCLVGCAVAASIQGVHPTATEAAGRKRRTVSVPKGSGGKIQVRRFGGK